MTEEIINDPFPHSVNKKIFSKKIWQEINQNWPEKDFFETYADGHNRTKKSPGRFGFYILGYSAEKFLNKLNMKNYKFWKSFSNFHLKKNIKKKFFSFLPYFRKRFEGVYDNLELQSFAVLVYTNKQIKVAIHTENPSVLMSGLIYKNNHLNDSCGTSIYRSLKQKKDSGVRFLNSNDFKIIRTFPFRDNFQFCFIKTNNSFHGVEKTSIKKGQERCSINWHIRLTDKSIEKIYKIKKFKDFARNNGVHEEKILYQLNKMQSEKLDLQPPTNYEKLMIEKSFC